MKPLSQVGNTESTKFPPITKANHKTLKDHNSNPPYDPEFVAMIKKGEQDLEEGKGVNITLAELEILCK